MKDLSLRVCMIPLIVLCLAFTVEAYFWHPAHDFADYYYAARFLVEGRFGDWVYFPYDFNRAIAAEGAKNVFASFAPNSPFLALFYAPFCFFTWPTAKLVLNLIGIFLLARALETFFRFYRIDARYLFLVPILFFVPIRHNLLFGQSYFILFFLLANFWVLYKRKIYFLACVCLALAILLKVFPVLLLMVFVFRKKLAELGIVADLCVVGIAISAFLCGAGPWLFYFSEVLPKSSAGEISEAFVPGYQSLHMALKTVFVHDPTDNPMGLGYFPAVVSAVVVGCKLGVVTIGYFVTRKSKWPIVTVSFWIMAALLLSPYGSTYGLLLLLFPFLALAGNLFAYWKKVTGFILIFVIANLPIDWLVRLPFPLSFLRLMLMIGLFSLFATWYWRKVKGLPIAAFALVGAIAGAALNLGSRPLSKPVLGDAGPAMVYDYKISKDKLTYYYWADHGADSTSTTFEGGTTKTLRLQGDEIWDEDELLSDEAGHKRTAVLAGNSVYYLSDYGRGIGFYTLRKKSLH